MIVSWFADRRTQELGVVARDFATALAGKCPADSVSLYVDRAVPPPPSAESPTASRLARALPANLRRLLSALKPSEHAVLALVAPLSTEVITAFDLSTCVFVLADHGVKSLRTAQRTFKVCRELGYPRSRLQAVLSTEPVVRDPVDAEGVAAALKREAVFGLPSRAADPAAWQAAMDHFVTNLVRRT